MTPSLQSPATVRSILAALLLLASIGATAQPARYRFSHIGVPDGLSQDIVTAICQDQEGFLWFGTEYGLNRYDGYTITVFRHNPDDSTSLSNNSIRTLFCDSRGTLWVGTDNGLNRLRRATLSFERVVLPPGISYISGIAEGDSGVLWIAAHRIVRYDPASVSVRVLPEHFSGEGPITALVVDQGGTVWAGAATGLRAIPRHRRASGEPDIVPERLRSADIRSLFTDSRGRLWIGSDSVGIVRRDPRQPDELVHVPRWQDDRAQTSAVFAFTEDPGGMIWAATWDGLLIIDPATLGVQRLLPDPEDPYALRSSRIYALCRDRAGAIWAGTWKGGLACHDPFRQRFTTFTVPPAETKSSSPTVLAISEDRSGTLWSGMSDGLRTLDRSSGVLVRASGTPPALGNSPVSALLVDSAGTLWAGALGAGLYSRDPGTGVWTAHLRGDPTRDVDSTEVRALLMERSGTLWAGTLDGLFLVDPGRKATRRIRDNPEDSADLAGEQIWSLAQTRDGVLWIGAWGFLNSYDPGGQTWRHFVSRRATRTTMLSEAVRAIVEDKEGMLWFGTWGGGLTRFDRKTGTFRTFLESDGLPNLFVKSIEADGNGHLWIGTEQGLSRFTLPGGPFRNFTEQDGLPGYFFMTGSSCRGHDGTLYFGGENGLTVVMPRSIRPKLLPPPVVITGVRIYDRLLDGDWSSGGILTLNHDEDYIGIDFSALDFTVPERNLYSHLLEGFDASWTDPSPRRYAAYTHLPPGEYTFRVRAANADGVWNEAGAALRFSIIPPFWMRWWFLVLAAATASGILYGFYLYRLRRLLAVERTRARIAEDLHDEISGTLSGVRFFASAIEKDAANRMSGPSARFLGRIGESTATMQESLADIIWAVNPEHDTWDQLFARCRRHASDLFDARGIVYVIETPPTPPRRPLDMDQRRTFWLVFKEMITNVIRHSACTRADVRILLAADGRVHLTVRDNGRGFDPTGVPDGNGTRNIRRRIAALGGTAEVHSTPGEGCRWEASFRI